MPSPAPVARLEWLARISVDPDAPKAAIAVAAALAIYPTAPGGDLFPSVPGLAQRAMLTRRGAQKGIGQLVALGYLAVDQGGGRGLTSAFRIIETANNCSPIVAEKGEPQGTKGRTIGSKTANHCSPDPSIYPREEPSSSTPPPEGYGLSDGQRAHIDAFDSALVALFGEAAARKRPAYSDGQTANQLAEFGITPEAFRAVCIEVMGKAAASGRNPPGSLSYCLKAAMEARNGSPRAPVQFAETANPSNARTNEELVWKGRIAGYKRTGMWLSKWGPRPGQLGCDVPKKLLNGEAHANA
jgi:hypothetical protein